MNFEHLTQSARELLQRVGFDVVRYLSLNTVFCAHGINVVFDVGANVGQYGSKLRRLGYRGRIVSFEPQRMPFEDLSRLAARDPDWTAVQLGLGSADDQKEMNIYDGTVLGSMLTLDQTAYDFHVRKVGTETIQIRTVDGILDQYAKPEDRVFLKIDTQGFEKEILRGAARSLDRFGGHSDRDVADPHLHRAAVLGGDGRPAACRGLRAVANPTWTLQTGNRTGDGGRRSFYPPEPRQADTLLIGLVRA